MCDYSLESVNSRKAVVGDKLVSHNFMVGTRGFKAADDQGNGQSATAICLLPGTEVAFDDDVKHMDIRIAGADIKHRTAIFRHRNEGVGHTHHDTLEFPEAPDGLQIFLTYLTEGQTATVIQMPVVEGQSMIHAVEEPAIAKQAPEYTD
jgi:hypothetical protein